MLICVFGDGKGEKTEEEWFGPALSWSEEEESRKKRRRLEQKQAEIENQSCEEQDEDLVTFDVMRKSLNEVKQDGWIINKTANPIRPTSVHVSQPNYSFWKRHEKNNPLKLIDGLLPPSIWEMIVEASEKRRRDLVVRMLQKKPKNGAKQKKVDSRYKKPITLAEIKRYFGWTWYWQSKHPSYSYADFSKEMNRNPPVENLKKYKIPPKRYSFLNSCLDIDIVDFAEKLSFFLMQGWSAGEIAAIDETIFEWLGEGEFTQHIAGKPHPDGLMVFFLLFFRIRQIESLMFSGLSPIGEIHLLAL